MVMIKTDIEGVLEEAKKEIEKAKKKEFSEIMELIGRASECTKSFTNMADKYEKQRLAHISSAKLLKRVARDLWKQLDDKISTGTDNPLLMKVLKKLRQEANDLWIKLDKLEKTLK